MDLLPLFFRNPQHYLHLNDKWEEQKISLLAERFTRLRAVLMLSTCLVYDGLGMALTGAILTRRCNSKVKVSKMGNTAEAWKGPTVVMNVKSHS